MIRKSNGFSLVELLVVISIIAGPTVCPWTTNNCGPNDEPFSFHTGGVEAMFGDGSVHFISENTDTQIIRKLANKADGEVVSLE